MGSAAVAVPIANLRRRRDAAVPHCGLAFDTLDGPVVAIAGLTGGAGTSTLAFALARQAAMESRAPILLSEASDSAGLTNVVGARSPNSLADLARQVAGDQAPAASYTELTPRLHLVATGSVASREDATDLRAVLAQARAAHGLVVLDCGVSRRDLAGIVAQADCVVWVVSASDVGVLAVRAAFENELLSAASATEVLVAREMPGVQRAKVRALSGAAGGRYERLALMRHERAISVREGDTSSLAPTLSAIAPIVRRSAS